MIGRDAGRWIGQTMRRVDSDHAALTPAIARRRRPGSGKTADRPGAYQPGADRPQLFRGTGNIACLDAITNGALSIADMYSQATRFCRNRPPFEDDTGPAGRRTKYGAT